MIDASFPAAPADLIEIRAKHALPRASLEAYLETHVDGFRPPLRVLKQFHGGQSNPTYFLATAEAAYVLRRKPPGKLLPSAHAVDREYRVLTALQQTGVPVPPTYCLCEDAAVIGTPFYVMGFVAGKIFHNPELRDISAAERSARIEAMLAVLVVLHRLDYQALGLGDFGRPGNYFARQINRWSKQYRASETQHLPAMERLMEWLPQNIPADDTTTLVHGDYRPGNMIFHADRPQVAAVLDWELSTLGHPLADLAYNCMPYYLPHNALDGISGLPLELLGYPDEASYIQRYCDGVGREKIEDWEFYVAFSIFRLAAISQGIMGRVRDGTASSADAEKRGRRAPILAELGWKTVREAFAT